MDEAKLRERLRSIFVGELQREVQAFRESLEAVRQDARRTDRGALLERAFRAAHSLTGAARSARYPAIEELCRRLDSALRPWRDAAGAPGEELLERLLQAGTVLQETAQRLAAGLEPDESALAQALAPRVESQSDAASPPPATGERPVLLLAEDSDTVRRLERTILEEAGYRVIEAEDGTAALDVARRERIDLVLADVDMPRMDGFELTRALRAEPATAGVPIVLLSGVMTADEESRGRAAGASAFLMKGGFDLSEILDTVARLLEARNAGS